MSSRINKAECRALRADGWKLDDLADRYGVTRAAVCMACRGVACSVSHSKAGARKKYRRARADEVAIQKEQVRSLYAAGLYPKQIAYDTGLSLSVVYYHLPAIKSPFAHQLRAGGAEGARQCA